MILSIWKEITASNNVKIIIGAWLKGLKILEVIQLHFKKFEIWMLGSCYP